MGGVFSGIIAGLGERAHEENVLGLQRQAEGRKAFLDLLSREADRLPEELRPQLFQLAVAASSDPKFKVEKQGYQGLHSIISGWQQQQRSQASQASALQPAIPEMGIEAGQLPPLPPPPVDYAPSPYSAATEQGMQREGEMTQRRARAQTAGTLEAQAASGLPPEAFHPGLRPRPTQAKSFYDAQGNAVMLNYDPQARRYTDNTGNEVDPTAEGLSPARPFKQTLGEQYVADRMAQGLSRVDAIQEYNTRYSTSTGVQLVEDIEGNLVQVPITRTTTAGRGKPAKGGLGATPPPPPKAEEAPLPGAGKRKELSALRTEVRNAEMRLKIMEQNASRRTGADDMSLVSHHMAMTVGGIKGMRVGRDIIQSHLQARSWPEDVTVLANRILGGEQLSDEQRQNFLRLAQERVQILRDELAATKGTGVNAPSPPPGVVRFEDLPK